MISTADIITGEKFQSLADVYIGTYALFFSSSTNTSFSVSKQLNIVDLMKVNAYFNNPPIVFVYPDVLTSFAQTLDKFANPYILITHNSDINIVDCPIVKEIVEHPKLVHWLAQNVCFFHPKIQPLPIGIANSKWEHGNLKPYESLNINKTMDVYMSFDIRTSPQKRALCKSVLENKGVPFLSKIKPDENLLRLSQYKYCICPEGNGVDTHRLWESLYTSTVPIVLNSPFIETLQAHYNFPMVILKNWEDFDICALPDYHSFEFKNDWLSFDSFKKCIADWSRKT